MPPKLCFIFVVYFLDSYVYDVQAFAIYIARANSVTSLNFGERDSLSVQLQGLSYAMCVIEALQSFPFVWWWALS